jgi:O-antigen/teichoic acid export membrane protein
MAASRNGLPPLGLRANFSWTLAGNVLYAVCQWGMLAILAKLTTTEMVGRFALGDTICNPIMALFMLQLRGVQVTDAKREYSFGEYLGLGIATTLVAIIVIIGIVFGSGYAVATALVIIIIGFGKGVVAVSDIYFGLLQQRHRMDRIAKSMMLKGPLLVAAIAAGVLITGDVMWGVLAVFAARLLMLFVYDIPSARTLMWDAVGNEGGDAAVRAALKPKWALGKMKQLAWLSLPLGLVMMLRQLHISVPRYAVERYMGESALGIFAAIGYIRFAGSTVVNALGQAASPVLAEYFASSQMRAYRRLMLKLLGLCLALGIGGLLLAVFIGPHILRFVYKAEYASHNNIFIWLMIAAGIQYMTSALGYGMTACRRFKPQVVIQAAAAVIAIVASLVLIPQYGLVGASWAVCIVYLIQIPLSAIVVLNALRQGGTPRNEAPEYD